MDCMINVISRNVVVVRAEDDKRGLSAFKQPDRQLFVMLKSHVYVLIILQAFVSSPFTRRIQQIG